MTRTADLSLSDVAEVASRLLGDLEQASGRVREVPDVRTLRYYTTLGLLDRPARMEGRTAFYGSRHVQQVVAIKTLQAQGATLSEVQATLLGAPQAQLDRLAPLPKELPHTAPAPAASAEGFWRRRPSGAEPMRTGAVAATTTQATAQVAAAAPALAHPELTHAQLIALAPGLGLMLTERAVLSDHDLSALREAARPLLAWHLARQQQNPAPAAPIG